MNLRNLSKQIRRDILEMGFAGGINGAHFGGSLSLVEIMASLYGEVMKFDVHNPVDESRDRLILSKGHGVIAQYAAMKQIGLFNDDLMSFKQNETRLYAHPSMNLKMGIEFSSGSLGQGLSLGVGTALALRRKQNNISRVLVILGDGECDEGSVWEAAMSAVSFRLDNIIAIVDRNHLQYDDDTEMVLPLEDFKAKWQSFGWEVSECNGHDTDELVKILSAKYNKPFVLVADTVKGKGVSFMENNVAWHNGVLTKTLYDKAVQELESV